MNHMTPTGIKGLDLYCLQDGKWIFAGSGDYRKQYVARGARIPFVPFFI